ncbi:MAG: PAC2 family protein, partial [Chloroflexota bacterium]|nr:PAC2 family protein [Chloroflexota bacterium]
PHAIAMIRPWVDVGSVGTLTLRELERHFDAREVGKLVRPGTFFDFTRYRPTVRLVGGQRKMTYPNSVISYAQPEHGPDLLFLHLLEPHAMAEDYVESIVELFRHFGVRVYCRLGAMYDSVPHTRPIVVTGNPGSIQPRPGAAPLIQQRQSQYEGPTTIMNLLTDEAPRLGIETMSFMVHLPHYAQLDEDFAGTARMLEVLSAYYDVPASLAPTERGRLQYAEVAAAVEQRTEVKLLVARLEAYYDSKYENLRAEDQGSGSDGPPTLSPEIERFLKDLDLGL